jgi:hypothetical protein
MSGSSGNICAVVVIEDTRTRKMAENNIIDDFIAI